jgi:metalloendopeptidase OMA1, mitochondrial
MIKIFLSIILFVSSGMWAESCATNSEGRRSFNIVSDSEMNALGVDAYQEILADARAKKKLLSPQSEKHKIVEAIGLRIAKASGADFKWEFNVIDEPKTVNAFCLPGGKIAVYTGILPVARTEAALAVVMGHEVAHATMRHGAERVSSQLAVAGLATAADITLQDSENRKLWMGVLALGANFGVLLPYSRGHETEADSVGLKYAATAGYDPRVAPGFWQRMGEEGGGSPIEFLSTHPDPENRSKSLERQQAEVWPLYEAAGQLPDKPLPR